MSAALLSHREEARSSDKLDQAYRLYRRRIARSRTENQVNRVHIALENYMTPAELRYFDAALTADSADSPSRRRVTELMSTMPARMMWAVEFERRGIVKGATRYTADIGAPAQKTLHL